MTMRGDMYAKPSAGSRVSLLIGIASVMGLLPAGASAATFDVTRTDDPAPDACAANDCSLREAVQAANATAAKDRIVLKGRTYHLTQAGEDEDATAGDLDIIAGSGRATIVGKGSGASAIDANDIDRVIDVLEDARASVREVTLRDGNSVVGGAVRNAGVLAIDRAALRSNTAGVLGGGVWNRGEGVLTITRASITGNAALLGGGLYNDNSAQATLDRTTIASNEANSSGGGLYSQIDAQLTVRSSTIDRNRSNGFAGGGLYLQNQAKTRISGSTISRNSAPMAVGGGGVFLQNTALLVLKNSTVNANSTDGDGGAFFVQNTARLALKNSTVSGNTADDEGGAIFAQNQPTIRSTFSTIARNQAGLSGGAIADNTSPPGPPPPPYFLFKGTLVADNSAAGQTDNCDVSQPGNWESQGGNLENRNSCRFSKGSDQRNAKARLRKLARNGAGTKTHALSRRSDAVDAAPKKGCPKKDQRGVKRPQGRRCDIGAYELKK